jgi:hypothetical protein
VSLVAGADPAVHASARHDHDRHSGREQIDHRGGPLLAGHITVEHQYDAVEVAHQQVGLIARQR